MPSDPGVHRRAARTHDAMAARHEARARVLSAEGDEEWATLEARNGIIERDAAALERDKAALSQRRSAPR